MSDRVANEIRHGEYLAQQGALHLWGWGTPAGQVRASRRGTLIAEAAGLGPGTVALEVGCGTGLFTEIFVRTGARVLAVDLSPDLLAHARARDYEGGTVEFAEARFETMGAGGPFDAVVGSSVLHHLEVKESVHRMFELLRAGGRLAFAEPNMLNPQIFMERRFRRFFPMVSPDETAFVRGRLGRLLEAAGFTDVGITPFDWLHPATPRPLIPAVGSLGSLLERLPGIREFSGSLLIRARKPSG